MLSVSRQGGGRRTRRIGPERWLDAWFKIDGRLFSNHTHMVASLTWLFVLRVARDKENIGPQHTNVRTTTRQFVRVCLRDQL